MLTTHNTLLGNIMKCCWWRQGCHVCSKFRKESHTIGSVEDASWVFKEDTNARVWIAGGDTASVYIEYKLIAPVSLKV